MGSRHFQLKLASLPCNYWHVGACGSYDFYKAPNFCVALCEEGDNFPLSGNWENGDTLLIKKMNIFHVDFKPSVAGRKLKEYEVVFDVMHYKGDTSRYSIKKSFSPLVENASTYSRYGPVNSIYRIY